jgi:hypothetical protein
VAHEAEHRQVANAHKRAFRMHAGAGSVDVALLYAARLPAGCGPGDCLGGGRLGQRLHVVVGVVVVVVGGGWGIGHCLTKIPGSR